MGRHRQITDQQERPFRTDLSQPFQYLGVGSHWITSDAPWESDVWAKGELMSVYFRLILGPPVGGTLKSHLFSWNLHLVDMLALVSLHMHHEISKPLTAAWVGGSLTIFYQKGNSLCARTQGVYWDRNQVRHFRSLRSNGVFFLLCFKCIWFLNIQILYFEAI